MNSANNPGVKFPPPLIYAGGFFLGLLLQKALPVPLVPRFPVRIAGLVCFAFCAMLGGWSLALFFRARTHVLPEKPASVLVSAGPYRITRNPMYIGLAFLYLGFALWLRVFWALAFLPAVIAAIRYYVIAREERYLERRFGGAYLAYKARVRRWI